MLPTGLTPIHSLTLVPNSNIGTDVYLWTNPTAEPRKFLEFDQRISERTFGFLLDNPSQQIYVQDASYPVYQTYLEANLARWLEDSRIPEIIKATVLAEHLRWRMLQGYEQHQTRVLMETSHACAETLVHVGGSIHMAGRQIMKSLRHDDSFVTHGINTAFYALLIAQAKKLKSEQLVDLCAGAMIHDIGKMIPAESGWTQNDTKAHPLEGFRMLCKEPGVRETCLMIGYQHHERVDGKGGPVGLVDNEILEESKICAVANRFDGLTSKRRQRPSMTRSAALLQMESECGTAIDKEAWKCLNQQLS